MSIEISSDQVPGVCRVSRLSFAQILPRSIQRAFEEGEESAAGFVATEVIEHARPGEAGELGGADLLERLAVDGGIGAGNLFQIGANMLEVGVLGRASSPPISPSQLVRKSASAAEKVCSTRRQKSAKRSPSW